LNPELLDWLINLNIEGNPNLSVLVIWGSQGSTTIFDTMLKVIPKFEDISFQVILWDKNEHFEEGFKQFSNTITYNFVSQKKLGRMLKQVDIAITRWWSTLWELTMFWIHSIIIPLNWSAGNHQELNALYFREKFWSDIILEENIEEELTKKLKIYKNTRKSWLNLGWFFDSLRIIDKELR
jgi:UDP-N-acetylglucosamine:LPS N-acetylglucosamine transferase